MSRRVWAVLGCLVLGAASDSARPTNISARRTKYPPLEPDRDPRQRRRLQQKADIVCTNLAGWTDSAGLQCFHYEANQWCTATGGVGPGWKDAWGSIQDYYSDGASALQACCACGGGFETAGCTGSISSWTDSDGRSCADYEKNHWCTAAGEAGLNWVASWGTIDQFASKGTTPQEACCACGRRQEDICMDMPRGWEDQDADTCAHYNKRSYCSASGDIGSGWDKSWGLITDYTTGGVSAVTACCTCGGGCYDDPNGWTDLYGVSCAEYAGNDWCAPDGTPGGGWQAAWGSPERYGRAGRNAFTACCECGGGSRHSAKFPVKLTCKDRVPGWRDKEGDTCLSYALHSWCTAEGGLGSAWPLAWGRIEDMANNSYHAYQACCGCGSGCSDTDLDWEDTDGDTCAFYESQKYCTPEGSTGSGWLEVWGTIQDFAVGGRSALDVCCACGGGKEYDWSPPALAPKLPGQEDCADLAPLGCASPSCSNARASEECCACGGGCVDSFLEWEDSYGADCDVYRENLWCTTLAGSGRGWKAVWGTIEDYAVGGLSALDVCCACGAGVAFRDYQLRIITTTPLPVEPIQGSMELSIASPQDVLQEGEEKEALEESCKETISVTCNWPIAWIWVYLFLGSRRMSGYDPRRFPTPDPQAVEAIEHWRRAGGARRLQNFGIVTVNYELRMPENDTRTPEAIAAEREELKARVAAVTPERATEVLKEKVGDRFQVEVLALEVAPDADEDTTTIIPTKLTDGIEEASSIDVVVIVAGVGIGLFSICLGIIAARVFWRACKAEAQKFEVEKDVEVAEHEDESEVEANDEIEGLAHDEAKGGAEAEIEDAAFGIAEVEIEDAAGEVQDAGCEAEDDSGGHYADMGADECAEAPSATADSSEPRNPDFDPDGIAPLAGGNVAPWENDQWDEQQLTAESDIRTSRV